MEQKEEYSVPSIEEFNDDDLTGYIQATIQGLNTALELAAKRDMVIEVAVSVVRQLNGEDAVVVKLKSVYKRLLKPLILTPMRR